jgi:hypothetical protein
MVSPLSEVANQPNIFQMPMIDFQRISHDPRLPLAHQVSLGVGISPTMTLAKLANHVVRKYPGSPCVFNHNALNADQKARLLQHVPAEEA